jgi:hypothetical protein
MKKAHRTRALMKKAREAVSQELPPDGFSETASIPKEAWDKLLHARRRPL